MRLYIMAGAKEKSAKEIKEKVKDYTESHTDTAKELVGLVRENYLVGFQLGLSLWEGNLKIMNSQLDQWLRLQQSYTNVVRELYEKFPAPWNENSKGINGQIDHFVAFQKDYIDLSRSASDKFTKEALSLTQKNVEKAFSLFDDYLSRFKA